MCYKLTEDYVIPKTEPQPPQKQYTNADFERTNDWTKAQFIGLAEPIFQELNNKVQPVPRYYVIYEPDTIRRIHIIREMFDSTCIWKYEYNMLGRKYLEEERLKGIRSGIIQSLCQGAGMEVSRVIDEPWYQEQIKKFK